MNLQDNIFRRPFHAQELQEWFQKNFPDSFTVEIFTSEEMSKLDELVWSFDLQQNEPGALDKEKLPTTYTLSLQPEFQVYSYPQNTYVYVVIYDSKGTRHLIHWGYQRCMVYTIYWYRLLKFILETYLQPIGTESTQS